MTDLRLLGRRLYGAVSAVPAALLTELFDHRAVADALTSSWSLEIVETDAPGPAGVLDGAYRAEIHLGFVMVKPDASGVWIGSDDHTVRLSAFSNGARLELFNPGMTGGGALMVGVLEALRASGLIPLHASVAAQEDDATAFLGESGRGKTTTLLTAITLGYTPVCEDFALLDPETDTLYALDRGLRLLPDTLERFQTQFPDLEPDGFARGKHLVRFERFAPRVHRARLRRILALQRDSEQDSRLSPMRPSEGVMALFASSGVPLLPEGRDLTAACFARLSRQLEIGYLWLGRTELPL